MKIFVLYDKNGKIVSSALSLDRSDRARLVPAADQQVLHVDLSAVGLDEAVEARKTGDVRARSICESLEGFAVDVETRALVKKSARDSARP